MSTLLPSSLKKLGRHEHPLATRFGACVNHRDDFARSNGNTVICFDAILIGFGGCG
jgi:hypothetical protein